VDRTLWRQVGLLERVEMRPRAVGWRVAHRAGGDGG
jgi:hypothetical protein